jgi:hypothetical protein
MAKLSLCHTAGLVLIFWGLASLQQPLAADLQATQATDIVVQVFEALKKGDVQTIRQYMSPELYKQYSVLFEQNTQYPAFLSKYYQGAKLRIRKTAKVRGHTQVQVAIDFPTGTTHEGRIFLRERDSELKIDSFLE